MAKGLTKNIEKSSFLYKAVSDQFFPTFLAPVNIESSLLDFSQYAASHLHLVSCSVLPSNVVCVLFPIQTYLLCSSPEKLSTFPTSNSQK